MIRRNARQRAARWTLCGHGYHQSCQSGRLHTCQLRLPGCRSRECLPAATFSSRGRRRKPSELSRSPTPAETTYSSGSIWVRGGGLSSRLGSTIGLCARGWSTGQVQAGATLTVRVSVALYRCGDDSRVWLFWGEPDVMTMTAAPQHEVRSASIVSGGVIEDRLNLPGA